MNPADAQHTVLLWFTDSRQKALFTGLWVPSIFALGGFYSAP